jgi:hypothetical protein
MSSLPFTTATRALYLRHPVSSDPSLVNPNAEDLRFRTVTIEPGDFDDPVECSLNCTTIGKSKDDYCALSYTWGSEDNPAQVYLNSLEFLVTQNLHAALRHIRDKKKRRTFFIDAICIAQYDLQEKSVQVRSMWSIYKHASEVLVFLGEQKDHTDTAFAWIKELGSWLANLPIDKTKYRYTNAPRSIKSPGYRLARIGLQDILERTFWTRVWVIQEVAVAKSVTVMCGCHTLPWMFLDAIIGARINSICDPSKYSSVFAWPSPGGNDKPTVGALEFEWHPASAIQMARRRYQLSAVLGDDHDPELGSFLVRFREFDCLDPRDKVYGVLQLSTRWAKIQPDYTKAVVDVFMDSVQSSIINSKGLAILSTLDYADTDLDRPSWCPNLANGPPNNLPYFQPKFRSSGSTVANVKFTGRVMTLSGYRVDAISSIPTAQKSEWLRASLLIPALMAKIRPEDAEVSPYGSEKVRQRAIERTVGLLSLGYCLKWFKRLQDPHLRYIPCLDARYSAYPTTTRTQHFGKE